MLGSGLLCLLALPYRLASAANFLRRIPQSEAFGVMAEVQLAPVEHLAHLAWVARVEAHPRGVGCKRTCIISYKSFFIRSGGEG